jgi:hypothetical protein
MERSASAAPRLADVVCRSGDGVAKSWFLRFLQRLLENSPAVTALLGSNPFPQKPPLYVRALLYDYRFSSREEKSHRRLVGAAAGGDLLSRASSSVMSSRHDSPLNAATWLSIRWCRLAQDQAAPKFNICRAFFS